MKLLPILLGILLFGGGLDAQTNFFSSTNGRSLPKGIETIKNINKFRVHRLDEAGLRTYLAKAPVEFKSNGLNLPVEIPMPDGSVEIFGLVESSLLSPQIAAQHPEIKSYTGNGLKNKEALIRLTLTSSGFHAVVLDYKGDEVYFEHYSDEDKDVYYNYFTRDAVSPPDFGGSRCGAEVTKSTLKGLGQGAGFRNNTGANLRTFRLAMAANKWFTAQNGGTSAAAFTKVINYVSTMNLIYRRELSVAFTLVSGSELIYTDDTYDNDLGFMLDDNQTNLDQVIGTANYDIGFVLGYSGNNSGGGLASFEAVCDAGRKAQGAGNEGDSPYAQVFADQLVLHEVGHMFGMNHSYNSVIPVCTTRNPSTSVEPGAGATIMSYGFTCDSDDYFNSTTNGPVLTFHTANYEQAFNFINTISCQVTNATGNTPPVVTMPSNVTVPKSTPFTLVGSANAPGSGDAYTYSWEGTDIGAIVPTAGTLDDTSQPPFFRSYEPSSSGSRTFPVLSAILGGTNQAKGDKLPSISTPVNLRLTVRDNNAAGGGLSYGSMVVTVDGNIGPFLETTNLSGTQAAGSMPTITWSVNGTDVATPNVNILLSTDGGLTFPTTLVPNTPNDGMQALTLPNIQTTTARIKVEAVGNIFFDISNNDFEIDIAGCTAATNTICPTTAETFTQGDAGLNLTLSNSFGTEVTQHVFDLNGSSPTGELANATMPGGTACNTSWGTESYETFDFSVTSTGTYTIANQSDDLSFSVFETSGYNPANPCVSAFIGSNSSGAISLVSSANLSLNECVDYKLIVWTINENLGIKTLTFSGPGSVLTVATTPANTGYTYIAVNNSNNQIAVQSATADFTSLTMGTYNVQGASYKNGGDASPPNSDPSTWVGQTIAAVQSTDCAVFSSNTKLLTVTQVVPVELVSFSGTTADNTNQLKWVSASEINLDYYEIQRSENGKDFTTLGKVKQNKPEGSNIRNYSFDDRGPINGQNYYRLKIIDLDGTFEYSHIIVLTRGEANRDFLIYPNPVSGVINFEGLPSETQSIMVRDLLGRVVMTQKIGNSRTLDVSNLPSGSYFLEVQTQSKQRLVKRFVKK